MSTINADKFGQICDDVWRDRAAILSRCGLLNYEDALARALYWRICKAGGDPGHDVSAYALLLDELVRRCRDEAEARESKSLRNPPTHEVKAKVLQK